MTTARIGLALAVWLIPVSYASGEPVRPPGVTSLTSRDVRFAEPSDHAVSMRRGPVTITVVDNEAVPPDHRAGYNGLASLTHEARKENLFVPAYAGLNLEHIHDGTGVSRERMFEPRRAPMRLRQVDPHTVELHQPPTPTWGLESCTRFALLEEGAVEMTFECIPRRPVFRQGYIGLFWASYIDKPESKAIHFIGQPKEVPPDAQAKAGWIEALSPTHGVLSTHVGLLDRREFKPTPDFPPNMLIFSYSNYVYTEPYYYGVSHGMAYALIFRRADLIRFSQSPTGGGQDNPAWDFQWFVAQPQVDKAYGFVMRMVYTPFKGRDLTHDLCRHHAAQIE